MIIIIDHHIARREFAIHHIIGCIYNHSCIYLDRQNMKARHAIPPPCRARRDGNIRKSQFENVIIAEPGIPINRDIVHLLNLPLPIIAHPAPG